MLSSATFTAVPSTHSVIAPPTWILRRSDKGFASESNVVFNLVIKQFVATSVKFYIGDNRGSTKYYKGIMKQTNSWSI